MLVLLGIAFLAGVITAISPCVLPVLPIVLAGGASGGRRRPYAIVGGLVLSFFVSVLFIAWILRKLGLPEDLLRNIAIALLFVVAATLLVPQLGQLIERPLARLSRRPASDLGGGFVLGASLGLVFVPCGGPVLGYVSAQAASVAFGAKTLGLTAAYALGVAGPMLAIAIGGRRAAAPLKARAPVLRPLLGVVVAGAALAIALGADSSLAKVKAYTSALQRHTEETCYAQKRLGGRCSSGAKLADYGRAPQFRGISLWLNTPGGRPPSLRGKVVLVDFWTYSCINCIRTLPHLKAWYAAYGRRGFTIVGVHTPEFAFEHVASNVRHAVRDFGVRYPVAIDNDYATWNAYRNEYWPAEYLLDKRGHIRHVHFGEGEYGQTERLIRRLLGERRGRMTEIADTTPTDLITPETYLGYERLDRYAGFRIVPNAFRRYRFPLRLGQNELAYAGNWLVSSQKVLAGAGARLRLHFHARDVYLVAGGHGTIDVLVNGRHLRRLPVGGFSRLYTILSAPHLVDALLELRFTPGLSGYSFTFG